MIHTFTDPYIGSNAYLVWEENSREAFILDLGCRPEELFAYADTHGITVRYLVLSHGHYDHAYYAADYPAFFPDTKLYCHAEDKKILSDPSANVSALIGRPTVYPQPEETLAEGNVLTLGGGDTAAHWRVLHTPGHTPGCICLYNETEKQMLTGDTLFADGGFGRYDFMYGDAAVLAQSLRRLLDMDGDIQIYPGHGRASTIRAEQRTRMYFGI